MSASASAAATPATSAAVTAAARNVTATHKRAGGRSLALYSSNVLEYKFCEVRIDGVLGSWHDLVGGNEIIFDPLANPVPHRPKDRQALLLRAFGP
jgi:hypothetical protein